MQWLKARVDLWAWNLLPQGLWGPHRAAAGWGPLGAGPDRGEEAGQRCLAVVRSAIGLPPAGKFLTFFLWVCKLMRKCGGCIL